VTLPLIERGRARAGYEGGGFELVAPGFVAIDEGRGDLAAAVDAVKAQIGFYGSTPAYRPVLELHGWEGLGVRLNEMTRCGRWDELGDAIPDEVFEAFAVVGTPEEVTDELIGRYGDLATRLTLALPEDADAERWAPLFEQLRSAGRGVGARVEEGA
jgi:hypothetical protein